MNEVKTTDSEWGICEKGDVSKRTSIKNVKLVKEVKIEGVTKAAIITKKRGFFHETEISIASIPVQEQKEEVLSMPRKCKREFDNLQASKNYNKIHHTKKHKD